MPANIPKTPARVTVGVPHCPGYGNLNHGALLTTPRFPSVLAADSSLKEPVAVSRAHNPHANTIDSKTYSDIRLVIFNNFIYLVNLYNTSTTNS